MKKRTIIILSIILVLIIIGFSLGFVFKEETYFCTAMACLCEKASGEMISGEIPCNSCSFYDPIFVIGIFTVHKECKAKEIIMCPGGDNIRYDINHNDCSYKIVPFLGPIMLKLN